MPVDEQGKPAGQGEPAAQVAQVLTRLSSVLATAHSGLDQLVKLNVYAADGAAVSAAQSAIAGRFKGAAKPAVMFVVGDLPNGVSVAMDGVALAPRFRDTTRVSRFHVPAAAWSAASRTGRGFAARRRILRIGRGGRNQRQCALGDLPYHGEPPGHVWNTSA